MNAPAFATQALPGWRRAVLKVGSSLLAANGGGLSTRHALGIAAFIAASHRAGREIVLVSSGAVAAGRDISKVQPDAGHGLVARQALAALGQTHMVALWQRFFDRPVAQVLLTHDDLRNRRRYLNARATLLELLAIGALPVVNENDTVAVDELKLGDNDNLAAIVAALVDADLLLIASDVAGLYTADPRHAVDACPVDLIEAVTPQVLAMAGGSGSELGTGGMRTKLEAALKAAAAGIETAVFDGTDANVLALLESGQLQGSRFCAVGTRLQARKYWLRHAPAASGRIRVDPGAAHALCAGGASLLPRGIASVEGEFARGDMVEIIEGEGAAAQLVARGISQYSSAEVRRISGLKSREIDAALGYSYGENVVHRDDMVALKTVAQA